MPSQRGVGYSLRTLLRGLFQILRSPERGRPGPLLRPRPVRGVAAMSSVAISGCDRVLPGPACTSNP
eukprot:4823212-Alexandrium_andersonii.AAC.1